MKLKNTHFSCFAFSLFLCTCSAWADPSFLNSYALVVGISDYQSREDLDYGRKDAEAIGRYLEGQGFDVIYLLDSDATRGGIVDAVENQIAPSLSSDDRVLFFYSGHGETRDYGDRSFGYIVPYEASSSPGTWVTMEEIESFSSKMSTAKHQLFILDSCYGGILGTKNISDYEMRNRVISELARRDARQILTAGGKDQRVLAKGPGGYSYFTGYLLEGLEDGLADLSSDGFVTATELYVYLERRASNDQQTPGFTTLAGHAHGDFFFSSPNTRDTKRFSDDGDLVDFGLKSTSSCNGARWPEDEIIWDQGLEFGENRAYRQVEYAGLSKKFGITVRPVELNSGWCVRLTLYPEYSEYWAEHRVVVTDLTSGKALAAGLLGGSELVLEIDLLVLGYGPQTTRDRYALGLQIDLQYIGNISDNFILDRIGFSATSMSAVVTMD